jgi:hypothetical protein
MMDLLHFFLMCLFFFSYFLVYPCRACYLFLFSLFWFFENHPCVILRLCPVFTYFLTFTWTSFCLAPSEASSFLTSNSPLLFIILQPYSLSKWPSGFRGGGTQSRGDLFLREGSPKSLNISALVAGWMHGNRVGGFRLCLPVLLQSRERPASREYVCFMP